VIEVKLDLCRANEVRRLIGQIASYSERAKALFIVLIDPDENMLDELEISLQALECKDKVEIVVMEADEEDEDEDEDQDDE
jgi:hypothetical protein